MVTWYGLVMHHWPRLIAIVVTGIVAAAVGAVILRTDPVYTETAAVLFTFPSRNPVETYSWRADSLIATGSIVSQVVMGPQISARIRKAGGTASYHLAMVNLYNDDYPEYGYPEALLTVSSASAASTHHTFVIARRMLAAVLASSQRQAGARPGRRIAASVTGDSGPVAESGSRKGALAGLLLLALVGGGTAWNLMSPNGSHRRG
jgi:hypothetical protein